MQNNPYDYENRSGVLPISWEDFHALCKGLAVAIASIEPEMVIPIGRAGYYPGTLIAQLLQLEIHPIYLSRRQNDIVTYEKPHWLLEPPSTVKDRRVVIIDEICSTGETLTLAKAKLVGLGARAVKTAVLYSHTKGVSVPDFIGLISDALILNPWDREVWKDGTFQFHPEYVEALRQQGLHFSESLLIGTKVTQIAKGKPAWRKR
jgi:uncharacterized protein